MESIRECHTSSQQAPITYQDITFGRAVRFIRQDVYNFENQKNLTLMIA